MKYLSITNHAYPMHVLSDVLSDVLSVFLGPYIGVHNRESPIT